MAVLHNRISGEELKQRLYEEDESRITISFYSYFPVKDPLEFRDQLYQQLFVRKVFGRIYVAREGINAQISVTPAAFDSLKEYLDSLPGLRGIRLNTAVHHGKSFWVLKVKVREKIVADGISDPSFDMSRKGKYVDAAGMNDLMKDPETVVIDMRNHYEYEVGHFENALEIPSDTFREQLPMAVEMMKDQKEKNIVMYCTGGIRCEKASAYMLHHGFHNVFHLEGGIIRYARDISVLQQESRFIGKNFVFDDRLGERITDDIIATCHQCGKAADTHINCANNGCHLLFIQCADCALRYEACCSSVCQEIIHLSAEEQKAIRQGTDKGSHIFNKAKARLRPRPGV